MCWINIVPFKGGDSGTPINVKWQAKAVAKVEDTVEEPKLPRWLLSVAE